MCPIAYKRCKCGATIQRQYKACDTCSKAQSSQYNREYNKDYRNQEANKFYHSKEWVAVRKIVLSRNPFCVVPDCNHPAKVVDHIVPIAVDRSKALDLDNLQGLCSYHHNNKTAGDMKQGTS